MKTAAELAQEAGWTEPCKVDDEITLFACTPADLERLIALARAELSERLERAEADARRLDWLQSTQNTVWTVTSTIWEPSTDGSNKRNGRPIFEGWAVFDHDDPQPTIRAAVDAAMRGE